MIGLGMDGYTFEALLSIDDRFSAPSLKGIDYELWESCLTISSKDLSLSQKTFHINDELLKNIAAIIHRSTLSYIASNTICSFIPDVDFSKLHEVLRRNYSGAGQTTMSGVWGADVLFKIMYWMCVRNVARELSIEACAAYFSLPFNIAAKIGDICESHLLLFAIDTSVRYKFKLTCSTSVCQKIIETSENYFGDKTIQRLMLKLMLSEKNMSSTQTPISQCWNFANNKNFAIKPTMMNKTAVFDDNNGDSACDSNTDLVLKSYLENKRSSNTLLSSQNKRTKLEEETNSLYLKYLQAPKKISELSDKTLAKDLRSKALARFYLGHGCTPTQAHVLSGQTIHTTRDFAKIVSRSEGIEIATALEHSSNLAKRFIATYFVAYFKRLYGTMVQYKSVGDIHMQLQMNDEDHRRYIVWCITNIMQKFIMDSGLKDGLTFISKYIRNERLLKFDEEYLSFGFFLNIATAVIQNSYVQGIRNVSKKTKILKEERCHECGIEYAYFLDKNSKKEYGCPICEFHSLLIKAIDIHQKMKNNTESQLPAVKSSQAGTAHSDANIHTNHVQHRHDLRDLGRCRRDLAELPTAVGKAAA